MIKPYFKQNWQLIVIGLVSLITVDVLQLIVPLIIKQAIDDLALMQIEQTGLLRYFGYLAGIGLLIGVFRYIWRRCLLGTSRRVEEGVRNLFFSHLQSLSATFFDNAKTGDLMAHATNDIQQVRMATGMGMVALNDALVLGTAAIAFMAYINIQLTLMVLIPMPFIVISTRWLGKKMHARYQDVQAAFSTLTEVVRERFAGIRIIKAYHWEKAEAARFEDISNQYIQKNVRLIKVVGSFFPMMLLLTNLSMAIVMYFGGRQTIALTITPGELVAFISYLGLLTWPMMALGWVTNLIQRGRASLDRLHLILQTRPEIVDSPDAVSLQRAIGSIRFSNVSFAYPAAEIQALPPVLDDINLQVTAGSILGIVGPPGSGKTSLINLIPRLYDTRMGKILIDGIDIRQYRLESLRSRIAFVPQEPFLFAGTVRENIQMGDQTISEADLTDAVTKAALYNTIQALPQGFDTVVGEKGVILSGGQKQRLALARAFLKNASILILDDPISQVDLETGSKIIQTIREMAGLKSVIIVSHRISAVRYADHILSLESGRIAEAGTHQALLSGNRYYAKAFYLQELEETATSRERQPVGA